MEKHGNRAAYPCSGIREKEMLDLTKKYYDDFGINEWHRLDSPSGQIEYAIFSHYIERYLKPSSVVLDIGGGPGRYAILLAKMGHTVALGDLSTEQIAIARTKIREAGVDSSFACIDEMGITDLTRFKDNTFDAVVSLGPFYHLTALSERIRSVSEIQRVLKPKGMAFVSAYTVYTWMNGLIERAVSAPDQVPEGMLSKVLGSQIYVNPTGHGFTNGYFFKPNELESLFNGNGFRIVDMVSSKSITYGKETEMGELREKRRAVYDEIMQLAIKTANDKSILTNSGQIMAIVESVSE